MIRGRGTPNETILLLPLSARRRSPLVNVNHGRSIWSPRRRAAGPRNASRTVFRTRIGFTRSDGILGPSRRMYRHLQPITLPLHLYGRNGAGETVPIPRYGFTECERTGNSSGNVREQHFHCSRGGIANGKVIVFRCRTRSRLRRKRGERPASGPGRRHWNSRITSSRNSWRLRSAVSLSMPGNWVRKMR